LPPILSFLNDVAIIADENLRERGWLRSIGFRRAAQSLDSAISTRRQKSAKSLSKKGATMNAKDREQPAIQIDELFDQDSRNIARELKRRALRETCDYVEEHMFLVPSNFENRYELLEYAVQKVSVKDGLWLEFGVYKGDTIKYIAARTSALVHGFDSFEGNPDDWRSEYRKGAFALDEIPLFPENVLIEKGFFQDSIPRFLKKNDRPVAFIHIDCDLYSSTKVIFDLMGERLIKDSIVVFDEYFNYPGWKQHEFKAFIEFVENGKKTFEYIGYVYRHSQVAIRITS
jgi:hypothetical protein